MEKQIKSFKDAIKFLDDIPTINDGGCGFAALSLYLWLKKNGYNVSKTEIVYMHRHEDSSYKDNKKFLENKSKRAGACSHAVLSHKGIFIDSSGVISNDSIYHPDSYSFNLFIKFNEEFFKKSLSNMDDWNYMFNREQCVPIIERGFGIDLTPYVM